MGGRGWLRFRLARVRQRKRRESPAPSRPLSLIAVPDEPAITISAPSTIHHHQRRHPSPAQSISRQPHAAHPPPTCTSHASPSHAHRAGLCIGYRVFPGITHVSTIRSVSFNAVVASQHARSASNSHRSAQFRLFADHGFINLPQNMPQKPREATKLPSKTARNVKSTQ